MKKTRIIPMLSLLCLLFSLLPAAYGLQTTTQPASTEKPSLQVGMYRVKNSLTMKLLIEKKPGYQLVVMLFDEKGRLMHKDFQGRKQRKYAQLLHFNQALDGTYTVVIKNGSEQITKEINLFTHKLYEMPRRLLIAEK